MSISVARLGLVKIVGVFFLLVTAGSAFSNEALFRINAGGKGLTDSAGNVWSADKYFKGGYVNNNAGMPIAGTADDAIYQTRRRNGPGSPALVYKFPTGNGEYSVNLHFSDNYSGTAKVGARLFDVYSEYMKRISRLDIYAQAGTKTALVVNIPSIKVTDGYLSLRFEDIAFNAIVSGIEVFKVTDSNGGTATPLAITSQPSNQIVNPSLNVTMAIAAEGPGTLSYQWYFNGSKISAATSSTLKLFSVTANNAGDYYCVVSSNGTSIKSNTAKLVVSGTEPPVSQDASITWTAPTKRADGTALATGDLVTYEVFHGIGSTSNMQKIGSVTAGNLTYIYKDLEQGTHYFALKAVDKNGLSSELSSTVKVDVN